jgi:glutathione peroxidase
MSIYDFTVTDNQGKKVSLSEYKGKVLLVVNTATKCGFTPQYAALQDLYDKHRDKGFEILDFPCNQFGHQAPGTDGEINEFCSLKFHTTFPRFSKIDVNGDKADPLYVYLKGEKTGKLNPAIKWNFTKFLVDKNGVVQERYASTAKPESLEADIEKLLKS